MALEVDVKYVAGVKFDISARGHHVACDQPIDNKGTDEGMTPPELLLASLGSCALYYAVEYLRARGLDQEEVSVRVRAEKEIKPARLGRFVIALQISEVLESRHREGIQRAILSCIVHNTLSHSSAIDVKIEEGTPDLEQAS